MSSIERQLAPTVVQIKQELTDRDAQLRELNLQYPGERKKKQDRQDPTYIAQRSAILDRKRLLAAKQSSIRRQLRTGDL